MSMAGFRYRARRADGSIARGVLEATHARQARQMLRERNLALLSMRPVKVYAWSVLVRRPALDTTRRVVLTRQLATLLQAGLPLAEALSAVVAQTEQRRARHALASVAERVNEGHSLAESLGGQSSSFPAVYRATVAAAERSGHLSDAFERLAEHGERQQALRQKLQLALVYPSLLLMVSLAVVAFLLAYVVPDVVQAFSREHDALPLATRLLIGLSDAVRAYGLYASMIAGALFAGVAWALRHPTLRYRWHALSLRLPGWRGFVQAREAQRFVSTLAILCKSGVALAEALPVAAAVVQNPVLHARLQCAARQVAEGARLSQGLERAALRPRLMLHLIASGERAGELDSMLERAALLHEKQLAGRVAVLVSLCEPLMLLVMGGIVLFIVLAILLPILNLNQLVT